MEEPRKYYYAVFLHPTILFLPDDHFDREWENEYWATIKLMDILHTVQFPFQNKEIPLNFHRAGFISVESTEIDDPGEKKQAFQLFYAFSGLMECYILGLNKIGRLSKNNNVYRRDGGAEDKFMHLICFDDDRTARDKVSGLMRLSINDGGSTGNVSISEFTKKYKNKIAEKDELKLDEPYYYLQSNLQKFLCNQFNEGILVIGWSMCEYLMNKIFESFSDDIQEKYKKSMKYLNAESMIKALKKQNCLDVDSKKMLNRYRVLRKDFLHDPVKESDKILVRNTYDLYNDMQNCITHLKHSLKKQLQEEK